MSCLNIFMILLNKRGGEYYEFDSKELPHPFIQEGGVVFVLFRYIYYSYKRSYRSLHCVREIRVFLFLIFQKIRIINLPSLIEIS